MRYSKRILGNGSNFGIKIQYIEQKKPNGLPEAFIIGEEFIKNKSVALILGDNFFYGQDFTKNFSKSLELKEGSTIFTYPVSNPQDYGVVEFENEKIKNIIEKPKKPKSIKPTKKGKSKDKSVKQLVIDIRREHSRKPDRIRNDIVELCGDLPRIELFARQKADGWDSWGNEI